MDNDTDKIKNEVRPKLEELAKTFDVCVTQALPTMLELLPNGCSKAIGVEKLCETLSIDVTSELLTIGDAENDSGMLKSACIGVAVGNACPKARECADYILDETNDEGGAGIAIETFALNR
jgi:hydroxymethylpyrimidine pyrophosphatase-like HAD family hydrolase